MRKVPAKIAILLKRNKKAISVAAMVCRPRNGEKAMKTPMEKASAVRSGGSSIASKRRNVARNTTLYLKPFNASASLSNESNTVRSLVITRRFWILSVRFNSLTCPP